MSATPVSSAAPRGATGPLDALGAAWFVLAPLALVALLALPVVEMIARVPPATLLARLGDPVVRDALGLSLGTALASTALVLVLGLPVAWWLATRRGAAARVLGVIVLLPMVIPPTVAGFALLMAFGRAGLLGGALARLGIALPFTTAAVVIAQTFMSAPFFVLAARAGFAAVDPRLTEVARSLGAGERAVFARVALPLARRALVAGVAMSAARALGEFGATITFAGNLRGVTQTMPLAVYVALQSDLDVAAVLAVLLLAMSVLLLVALGAMPGLAGPGGGDADGRGR